MDSVEQKQGVVLLSGGIDSTACAHFLKSAGFAVSALFIDYGHPANPREHEAAASVARELGIHLATCRITANTHFSSGEVRGRNAFLIYAALMYSSLQHGVIAMGVHAGTPYYDCSETFVSRISKEISELTDGHVQVFAPFVTWDKSDITDYAKEQNISLLHTYSCEEGGNAPCGTCLSCKDREELLC